MAKHFKAMLALLVALLGMQAAAAQKKGSGATGSGATAFELGTILHDIVANAHTCENRDCGHEVYWCQHGSVGTWSHHCTRCVVNCESDEDKRICAGHYLKECIGRGPGEIPFGDLRRSVRGCFYKISDGSAALPRC